MAKTPMSDDTTPYVTTDYDGNEPVPSAVAAEFAAPTSDAWDTVRTASPHSVPVRTSYDDRLYEGVTPDERAVYVSENGNTHRRDEFDYVTHVGDNYTTCMDTPFTFHSGIECVHHDHMVEHVTAVAVVFGDGETFRLYSRSGVVYHDYRDDSVVARDAPERVRQLAVALSDTEAPTAHDPDTSSIVPDVPDGIERWTSGSHRTDRPTRTSERWNALASGDVPSSWDDDSIVAFVNSDTRNVCHRSLTAYANQPGRAALKATFDTDTGSVSFP